MSLVGGPSVNQSCFHSSPMRAFGRLLQHLGLLVPPLAIVLQLAESIDVRLMLMLWVFAMCLFWIGRLVEGYGGKAEG